MSETHDSEAAPGGVFEVRPGALRRSPLLQVTEAEPSPGTEKFPSLAPLTAEEQMTQLRDRVRALEMRLDRMDREGTVAVAPVEQETVPSGGAKAAKLDTETAAATIFTRIAMLCFVLLGALILRVLTQQNILGAGFGTILGFAYAGHLIVLSLLPRRFGVFARDSSLFQCSGAILAFFIAIESALRTHTMGRVPAMIAIAGFSLLALGMSIRQRKGALAGAAIIGGMLAFVALDLRVATVALQLTLVVLFAVAGLVISWREGWHWLRPATLGVMMLLLPAGFFFRGEEPGVVTGLLAASAGIWCAAVLQHLGAFRRLGPATAWLPVLTLWFAGVQQIAGWPFVGATTGGIAAFALICVVVFARRVDTADAGLVGMIATSALAGAIGWAMLDRTGLLCAVGGLALWFAGRRAASDWTAVFVTLLMLAAAGVGLAQLARPPVAVSGLTAMSLSALILVLHYVRNGHAGIAPYSGLAMRLAPISLASGLALLLGLFWQLVNRLFDQPAHLLLSQTVVLVITALALTFWGHAAHRRSPLFCGLACMALALVKVLLIDLMRLKSYSMLASLVLVGLASIAVSVILRRHQDSPGRTAKAQPL